MTIAFVETPAPEPKSEHDHRGNNAAAKRVPRGAMAADKGQFFALAERWLRPADQRDYMIRRWLIPVPFEPNRLIATDPSKHSRGAKQSKYQVAPSRRGNGLLSEVGAVIAQYFLVKCEIPQPIPARRVVGQLERRKGDPQR